MTILYTPRELLDAMKIAPVPDRFLREKFVKMPEMISDKKYIELDKEVNSQATASYATRTGSPNIVNKLGFSSALHVAPYIYEAIPMTSSDMDTREPGENIYEANAATDYDRKVAKWTKQLEDRMSVAEEKQVADGLMSGTIVVPASGGNYTVDFGMPAAQKITLTAGNVWGTTTAILDQLKAWAKLLSNQGYVARDLLLDPDAATLLLADATVVAKLNNWRIAMGEIKPQVVAGQRASYLGSLAYIGLNLDLWVYNGGYKSDASTFVNFLSSKKAIMIGEGLEIVPCYSKIENLKSQGFRGRRFPNMWVEGSGKEGFISLESGPLMAIRNPEAIVSATVA